MPRGLSISFFTIVVPWVMLSAAKHLAPALLRPFAALRLTVSQGDKSAAYVKKLNGQTSGTVLHKFVSGNHAVAGLPTVP
jgi:hypothetical protein